MDNLLKEMLEKEGVEVQFATSNPDVQKIFDSYKPTLDLFVRKLQSKNYSVSRLQILEDRVLNIIQSYAKLDTENILSSMAKLLKVLSPINDQS